MYSTTPHMSSPTSQIHGDCETHASAPTDAHISESMKQDHQPPVSQLQPSHSHLHLFQLPPSWFSDSVDDDSSDTESYHVEDLYGSDSDAEIIGRLSPIHRSPSPDDPPSSDENTSVRSDLLHRITYIHTGS